MVQLRDPGLVEGEAEEARWGVEVDGGLDSAVLGGVVEREVGRVVGLLAGGGVRMDGSVLRRLCSVVAPMVFCYASGVYATRDMELSWESSRVLRGLAGEAALDPHWIRRVRRSRPQLLQTCLAAVLEAMANRGGSADGCLGGGARGGVGGWRRGSGMLEFEQEAAARIHRAIVADSRWLDE